MTRAEPGPHNPVESTPRLPAGAVRRTTTIDVTRPDGLLGRIVIDIRGRDVRGSGDVVDRLAVTVDVDQRTGAVVDADLADLVGVGVRAGYGRRLAELLPDERDRRSLLYSALEDLGGAFLVSGYAPLRAGLLTGDPELAKQRAPMQENICIGWATETPVYRSLRRDGVNLVPMGPPAPPLDDGWHEVAPMAPGTVRRRRRLDVSAADSLRANSHFRDSHASDEGETVMHEYLVDARIDEQRRVQDVSVDPCVLPWRACPGAAPSGRRVVGVAIDEIPARVRADLVGPSTCTHLNSTLRCLADVAALAPLVGR